MILIGHKTLALFDLWSLFHFLAGIAIGNLVLRLLPCLLNYGDTLLNALNKVHLVKCHRNSLRAFESGSLAISLILLGAYGWELLEFNLEQGAAGPWIAYWFQGQEHWLNRLLADPILLLMGYGIGHRYRSLVWPARSVLLIWVWIFLFFLPNSMGYL